MGIIFTQNPQNTQIFLFWRYISGVSKLHFESTELSLGAKALRRAARCLSDVYRSLLTVNVSTKLLAVALS